MHALPRLAEDRVDDADRVSCALPGLQGGMAWLAGPAVIERDLSPRARGDQGGAACPVKSFRTISLRCWTTTTLAAKFRTDRCSAARRRPEGPTSARTLSGARTGSSKGRVAVRATPGRNEAQAEKEGRLQPRRLSGDRLRRPCSLREHGHWLREHGHWLRRQGVWVLSIRVAAPRPPGHRPGHGRGSFSQLRERAVSLRRRRRLRLSYECGYGLLVEAGFSELGLWGLGLRWTSRARGLSLSYVGCTARRNRLPNRL